MNWIAMSAPIWSTWWLVLNASFFPAGIGLTPELKKIVGHLVQSGQQPSS
jgi:hypothetical protein